MGGGGSDGFGRRGFFQEALARMLKPVVEAIEERLPQILPPDEPPPRPRIVLRPPGALDEGLFNDTCRRCGACVAICPAKAIFAFEGKHEGDRARGTPVIDADLAACVICDGLLCTTVCPSGALRKLTHPSEIRMGTAEVYAPLCVRSNGEDCTECVTKCPVGPTAIRFDHAGPPVVLTDGCTGCGVCQLYCPTSPKAIVVRPA